MVKVSREQMERCRLMMGLIIIMIFLYVSGCNGQDISTEEVTTIFSQQVTPALKATPRIQFPKDRTPSGLSKRIIGGSVATPNAYPYQAALYVVIKGTLYFCGGTLITPQWVLTAAHCVDQASLVQVILGVHNINQPEASSVTVNSSTFIIHEGWDETILQNDIALILLPQNVSLNTYINTIEIAQGTDSYSGILGRCLGWGQTILGIMSSVLRYVDVEVITNENCSQYDDYTKYIVDHHLCTSGEGIVGSCNGDSGGPLIIDGIQVGIVSFGVTNCTAGIPSVFTRVTEFNSWITENTGNWNGSVVDDQGGHGGRIVPFSEVCLGVMLGGVLLNYYL